MNDAEKIQKVLDTAFQYAGFDGGHHKAWCIDQMVRILAGDNYEKWVKDYQGDYDPEEEEFEYEWDVGIPP